jgi:hypothetical protein
MIQAPGLAHLFLMKYRLSYEQLKV